MVQPYPSHTLIVWHRSQLGLSGRQSSWRKNALSLSSLPKSIINMRTFCVLNISSHRYYIILVTLVEDSMLWSWTFVIIGPKTFTTVIWSSAICKKLSNYSTTMVMWLGISVIPTFWFKREVELCLSTSTGLGRGSHLPPLVEPRHLMAGRSPAWWSSDQGSWYCLAGYHDE